MESNASYVDENTKQFIFSMPTNHFLQYLSEQVTIFAPYIYQPTVPINKIIPPVSSFISLLVKRSRVKVGTLLATLIVMRKLKKRLNKTRSSALQGLTLHTVFLGCVILTTKYLHDASPKNSRWARYAAYFTTEEINTLERRLLIIMDHHLNITKEEVEAVLDTYYCIAPEYLYSVSSTHFDKQYLPKAASLSSFIRPIGTKQSSLYSLVHQFKISLAELRKLPSSSPKSKSAGSNKLGHSSKTIEESTPSSSNAYTSVNNNAISNGSGKKPVNSRVASKISYYTPESNSSTLLHSWSLLDTAIPSGDLLMCLSEHISSTSLESNSTVDNDSVASLAAFENNNKNCIDTESNIKDPLLPNSPTSFADTLLDDDWLQKLYQKDFSKRDNYMP